MTKKTHTGCSVRTIEGRTAKATDLWSPHSSSPVVVSVAWTIVGGGPQKPHICRPLIHLPLVPSLMDGYHGWMACIPSPHLSPPRQYRQLRALQKAGLYISTIKTSVSHSIRPSVSQSLLRHLTFRHNLRIPIAGLTASAGENSIIFRYSNLRSVFENLLLVPPRNIQ